jgi:hypothetical protein
LKTEVNFTNVLRARFFLAKKHFCMKMLMKYDRCNVLDTTEFVIRTAATLLPTVTETKHISDVDQVINEIS